MLYDQRILLTVVISGSIALGDVAERTDTLSVACNRCTRAGQYPIASLIERHGPRFGVPELLRLLSADCVKRQSISMYDLCGVCCPDLSVLFGVLAPR